MSRHWSAQNSGRGRVINDAASRRYLDQKKSLGMLHPNGLDSAYIARPLSPHLQYVIECCTQCLSTRPRRTCRAYRAKLPDMLGICSCICKHCACVALNDEVHLVKKSLKVLRQNGQKSQRSGPCEPDHLQWVLGVECTSSDPHIGRDKGVAVLWSREASQMRCIAPRSDALRHDVV